MKSFFALLAFALILSSCGDTSSSSEAKEKTPESVEQTQEVPEMESTNTAEEGDLLQFNNGKKWLANPETSEGMLMMQIVLKVFYETSEENRNYAELTGELQYQCNYIIENCSMKGEAHDQLHKVLHPILENISSAQNAGSYEEADANLKKVNELIDQYLRYFEVEESPA